MRAAVVVFPGSNCDRDLAVAFEAAGAQVEMVWHKDSELPQGVDIVGITCAAGRLPRSHRLFGRSRRMRSAAVMSWASATVSRS
jgi:hypothetical protein